MLITLRETTCLARQRKKQMNGHVRCACMCCAHPHPQSVASSWNRQPHAFAHANKVHFFLLSNWTTSSVTSCAVHEIFIDAMILCRKQNEEIQRDPRCYTRGCNPSVMPLFILNRLLNSHSTFKCVFYSKPIFFHSFARIC